MMIQPPKMASLFLFLLSFSLFRISEGAWCVCRSDVSTPALQKTLDYACGAGADCNPIHQNGACYNPNTVLAHCSYAANSYYQRNNQNQQACDFSGTAQLSNTDPSSGGQSGCTYPATPSAAGTSSSSSSTSTSSTGGGGGGGGGGLNSPTTTGGTFSNTLGPSGGFGGLDSSHAHHLLYSLFSGFFFFFSIFFFLVFD